jgi:hypothetical protein
VLSKSTLTVVITIHIIPIIICVYLLIRNLKSNKLEQLFLYIESVPAEGQKGGGTMPANLMTKKALPPSQLERIVGNGYGGDSRGGGGEKQQQIGLELEE